MWDYYAWFEKNVFIIIQQWVFPKRENDFKMNWGFPWEYIYAKQNISIPDFCAKQNPRLRFEKKEKKI